MDKLLYLLPILACPIGMSLMMWLMMRDKPATPTEPDPATREEIAMLRAEIATLRSSQASSPTGDPTYRGAS